MRAPGRWHLAPEFVVVLAGVSAALHVGKLSPALPVLRDAVQVSLLEAGFPPSMVQFAGYAGVRVFSLVGIGLAWGLRRELAR
jgi:CP family cyanate transporter-like MFS transporter